MADVVTIDFTDTPSKLSTRVVIASVLENPVHSSYVDSFQADEKCCVLVETLVYRIRCMMQFCKYCLQNNLRRHFVRGLGYLQTSVFLFTGLQDEGKMSNMITGGDHKIITLPM